MPLTSQGGSTPLGLSGWWGRLRDGVLFGLISQALAVRTHNLVHGVGQVVEQVKSVRHLDRVRRALLGALGITSGTITTDHSGARMGTQPVGKRVRQPIGQQIHGPMGLHVDHDAAIVVGFPEREVVDVEHGNRAWFGYRQCPDQPQQRRPGHRDGQLPG